MSNINVKDLKDTINRKEGEELAYNLNETNPADVSEWISSGCEVLDMCTASSDEDETVGGFPMGRVSEIAGLESTGKSFLAAKIAAKAQEQGVTVVYFESESTLQTDFLKKAGVNVDDMLYIQAKSIEFVMETMEFIISEGHERVLFILDTIAMTPTRSELSEGYDPKENMAAKARVLSKSFKKITIPIANSKSAFLCLNQLKTRIKKAHEPQSVKYTKPYYTPGGKSTNFAYSLRVWLKRRGAKNAYKFDENGDKIGAEVKAEIKKSKFGTEGKKCEFDIMWGGENVGFNEAKYWLDFLKESDHPKFNRAGAWYKIEMPDGSVKKFQGAEAFEEAAQEDEELRQYVLKLLKNGNAFKDDEEKDDSTDEG